MCRDCCLRPSCSVRSGPQRRRDQPGGTVEELRELDPGFPAGVYSRTMRIGVAHLAANINTLVFAYLGAALPLIVLLAVQVPDLTLAANQEFVAVEIIRAVVGAWVSLAVPLTTASPRCLRAGAPPGRSSARSGPPPVPDNHEPARGARRAGEPGRRRVAGGFCRTANRPPDTAARQSDCGSSRIRAGVGSAERRPVRQRTAVP